MRMDGAGGFVVLSAGRPARDGAAKKRPLLNPLASTPAIEQSARKQVRRTPRLAQPRHRLTFAAIAR